MFQGSMTSFHGVLEEVTGVFWLVFVEVLGLVSGFAANKVRWFCCDGYLQLKLPQGVI